MGALFLAGASKVWQRMGRDAASLTLPFLVLNEKCEGTARCESLVAPEKTLGFVDFKSIRKLPWLTTLPFL